MYPTIHLLIVQGRFVCNCLSRSSYNTESSSLAGRAKICIIEKISHQKFFQILCTELKAFVLDTHRLISIFTRVTFSLRINMIKVPFNLWPKLSWTPDWVRLKNKLITKRSSIDLDIHSTRVPSSGRTYLHCIWRHWAQYGCIYKSAAFLIELKTFYWEGWSPIENETVIVICYYLCENKVYMVTHRRWHFKDDCPQFFFHLWFSTTLNLLLFLAKSFKRPLKDSLLDKRLTLTLESSYSNSFRSSLQSHPL